MTNTERLHYFDYAATTPADPRVISAMCECLGLGSAFGHPVSTSHHAGMRARGLVERAQQEVAALIGADAREIVWTSGATESNHLALKGCVESVTMRKHIVTSALEHKTILDTVACLEKRGTPVTYVRPGPDGSISPAAVAAALREDTALVSLMLVNNEIGTLTDIAAISPLVHAAGALLHVDAAQALGKTPIDVKALGIDLMSMSAHKVYGPKGIGALYVREEIAGQITPLMHGSDPEPGPRSGTLPTHQIFGMGTACALAAAEMEADTARIAQLSAQLLDGIASLGCVTLNARTARRIPHTLSLCIGHASFFPFLLGPDFAVSSTSACCSAAGTPSHVLMAIGLDAEAASRTIRLSLGRFTKPEDVEFAIGCLRRVIESRSLPATVLAIEA